MNSDFSKALKSKREAQEIKLRNEAQNLELLRRRVLESNKLKQQAHMRVEQHQLQVHELVQEISMPRDEHIDMTQAFDLINALLSLLQKEETQDMSINVINVLQGQLLEFRDTMAAQQGDKGLVQFQLLTYHADDALKHIDRNHYHCIKPETILNILTKEKEPRSRDFLILNPRKNELWLKAIAFQGLELKDKKLMESLIGMLEEPYAWKFFTDQRKMPFDQVICDKAWEKMECPYVEDFIIQQIKKYGEYFDSFRKLGMHKALRVFIMKTYSIEKTRKVQKIQDIMQCLSNILFEDAIFDDVTPIYDSLLLDSIADLSVSLFNQEALFSLFRVVQRLVNHPDINQALNNYSFLYRLFKLLLNQTINEMVEMRAMQMINTLCEAGIQFKSGWQLQELIANHTKDLETMADPQIKLERPN